MMSMKRKRNRYIHFGVCIGLREKAHSIDGCIFASINTDYQRHKVFSLASLKFMYIILINMYWINHYFSHLQSTVRTVFPV